MPKIVALDFGLKRIGVAITDDLNIIASGLDTVMTHEIIPFLKDLTNKFEIRTFVIGKPVQKDNTPSEIEYDILKFIKILHKTFLATRTLYLIVRQWNMIFYFSFLFRIKRHQIICFDFTFGNIIKLSFN